MSTTLADGAATPSKLHLLDPVNLEPKRLSFSTAKQRDGRETSGSDIWHASILGKHSLCLPYIRTIVMMQRER